MEHVKASAALLARQLLAGLPEQERVPAAWPQVCGPQAAVHAHAESFAAGLLRVRVDDPAWLSTLDQLRGQYGARLGELTGVQVREIVFVPSRKNL